MAKKKEVQEIVPPGSPLPESENPDAPAAPTPDRSPIECGYVISVQEDGTLMFDIIGTNPNLVGLVGLHVIAEERLASRLDKQLGGKYSLILDKLNKISEDIQ